MAVNKASTRNVAIRVKALKKSYKKLHVLKGIDFNVPKGTIMALLGPNGAGKTTTIKILSTLLIADSGNAVVNGYDVKDDADGVRGSIGLTGQYAAVDEYLTGKENLELIGRLYRLDRKLASARADKLLEKFDLVDASKRAVKTYSGGMRRRLDLAMSLIASPPIIFLDEPTTGLDPRSRLVMWDMIKDLANSGTTILLTTQYMEEADQLADYIVVIDDGKVIAQGTSTQLKAKIGSSRIEISLASKNNITKAMKALESHNPTSDQEKRSINVSTKDGVNTLKDVLGKLENAKIKIDNISLHQPTLDDVFLSLTGKGITKETEGGFK
ncbi:MAG: ATP-binding cassette domain-containing protein [bacterium]|nr:ATP-binding cassette domain-containing protein [bacterium]